jgi:hypothetical protein
VPEGTGLNAVQPARTTHSSAKGNEMRHANRLRHLSGMLIRPLGWNILPLQLASGMKDSKALICRLRPPAASGISAG